ncbi:hypothetical protein POV27_09080 [Aureisphaera galaxeae]|uniref:hypothetical protein n=1 Tax=Aureisphaera galaxeae TaxID=1538023 RepID=UPI0023500EA1|nr:hypothetical protein [Aureisphaera galaxeae]MDC8004202.1 hypothetical protein [Aureisphaera galaxeae]
MQKLLRPLFLALLFISMQGYAQIGMNTTDPEGMLDISSTTQGVIMPRVALTNTTVAAPVVNNSAKGPKLADGTMVYNTNTVNDVFPGYYYWQTDRWIRLDGKGKQFHTITLPALNNNNVDFSLTGANNYIDIFRLDRSVGSDIFLSGIDGGTHGKAIQVYNLSSTYQLTILSELNAAASSAENRFFLDQDVVLKPGRGTILVYDGVVNRWIVFRGDN